MLFSLTKWDRGVQVQKVMSNVNSTAFTTIAYISYMHFDIKNNSD